MPPAWRHRRFPPPLASLLLWAVVACSGALGLAATRLQQLHAAFETDARIVHRLLSQRVVQHDAIMATLALLQPGAAAGDAASAAPLPRLPSVYPQILAVLQRTGQDPWPVPLQAELSAAEATSRRTGHAAMAALDLPAGRYDTILPPTAMADLMIDAYWSAGARVAWEGQSVYSRRGGGTRVGQRIARPGVNLRSDPAYAGLECAPFTVTEASSNEASVFDNGLELGRTDWVRGGELAALRQTRHTAAMTSQPVTPTIDNLVLQVDGGSGAVGDLVAGTERGLLLTCLWYVREVDPQTLLLTGLTRDGVYLVENGEITAAVNNFRWNESPVDLLRRFSHASATVPSFSREWGDDYFSRTATPALRVPDFNMSSVSPAQ